MILNLLSRFCYKYNAYIRTEMMFSRETISKYKWLARSKNIKINKIYKYKNI